MNALGTSLANRLAHLSTPALLLLQVGSSGAEARAAALSTNLEPQLSISRPLPPHPRLLLNSNGIVELKNRINTVTWAKASWAELKRSADSALARPIELPPRGGNWSHNYVCPTHSARLTQGKQIGPWQWEHICPVGHHILQGDPSKAALDFDGNAIAGVHGKFAQQAVNYGLLFQVTGEVRYAQKAGEILQAYAKRYLEYPMHDNQGKPGRGGRVASQSLTEASWLIEIAQGADLVWSTLSEGERRAIAEQLLRPALEQVLFPTHYGIHNIQCRLNSAIGLVGLLLDDAQLVSKAIDDPKNGFRQQLAQGVREDGMWIEGSSGYHFFTIAGLWPLAEAARNCGLNLYDAKFQSLFDGPLALAMPNFVLPNFNDSGTVPLENEDDLYELAFARFQNPAYLGLLSSSSHRGRLALLYGVNESAAPAAVSTPRAEAKSHNSIASGYAILQRGSGQDATWLCVKYGPHGGGHGHPDKNSFILYAHGQILATDAGTHAYGSPLHRDWDKTTFAHNTLVVDEKSQAPATGSSLAFGTEQGVDYSITGAGPIYQGVAFTRTVALLNPQLIVFIDQVQAEAEHTFDLAYHQFGEWPEVSAAKARPLSQETENSSFTQSPGYTHFTRTTSRANCTENLALTVKAAADSRPAITLANQEPTEVVTGYGVMKTTEDLVPLLLQRRHAQRTAFVWAISLDGVPVTLSVDRVNNAQGESVATALAALVKVSVPNGNQWSLLVNPRASLVQASLADHTVWRTAAPFAVRVQR
jgi:oligo-alginate lyase